MITSYIESIGYSNQNIQTGAFREINLEKAPFNLPAPIDLLDDGPMGRIERRLCLWNVQDLQQAFK
jgi:hypothetical protein